MLRNVIKTSDMSDPDSVNVDVFTLILKAALHPVACSDRDSLKKMTNKLQSLFGS